MVVSISSLKCSERNFRSRIDSIREELQCEADIRFAKERAELREAREAMEAAARTAARTAAEQAEQAEPASVTVRNTRVDTVERLLGAVRRIDRAGSLSGILEALAKGASAQTSRVAVLLVDGDMFHTWGHFGFAPGVGPSDMPIGVSGTLAAAVALRQTSFVPPMLEGRDSSVPEFMRVPAGFTGLVVPLSVGGDVVAVLYADDVGRTQEQEDAPVWTEEVELLARHAAVRLENVTSFRTVEVMAHTAGD